MKYDRRNLSKHATQSSKGFSKLQGKWQSPAADSRGDWRRVTPNLVLLLSYELLNSLIFLNLVYLLSFLYKYLVIFFVFCVHVPQFPKLSITLLCSLNIGILTHPDIFLGWSRNTTATYSTSKIPSFKLSLPLSILYLNFLQ
jgi:hypothetical protein